MVNNTTKSLLYVKKTVKAGKALYLIHPLNAVSSSVSCSLSFLVVNPALLIWQSQTADRGKWHTCSESSESSGSAAIAAITTRHTRGPLQL
jgi:hypothetical protein